MLRTFHRVAGLAVAIPLTLTALSGALLLLRDPYYRWQFPTLDRSWTTTSAEERGAILNRVDAMFAPAKPRVVKFPRDRFNAYHVYLTDGSEAFVDARDGTLLDRWRWHERAAAWVFELHAHLLAGDTGKIVNGVAAIAALLLLASGLGAWWPRRRSLPPSRALPAGLSPATLLRSHAATGVLVALPLGLFAATGAGIVFYEPVSRIMSGVFDHRPPLQPDARVAPSPERERPWREVIAAADAALGGTRPAMVYPGTAANAAIRFRTRLDGEWHPNGRSYVLVNPYDASVVQVIDARAEGRGTRAMHALYPLHAARAGGVLMIALAAVTGIALGWLGVGGAYLYAGRWRRARGCAHREPGNPRTRTREPRTENP